MKITTKKLSAALLLMAVAITAVAQRYNSIRPGQQWLDTKGNPIHAHSPQIFVHDGVYSDDTTGKAYVWFERPHWEMICAELSDDYLGTNGKFSEHFIGLRPPYTREAPSHFVYRGRPVKT